jgi:hypothetical protein
VICAFEQLAHARPTNAVDVVYRSEFEGNGVAAQADRTTRAGQRPLIATSDDSEVDF